MIDWDENTVLQRIERVKKTLDLINSVKFNSMSQSKKKNLINSLCNDVEEIVNGFDNSLKSNSNFESNKDLEVKLSSLESEKMEFEGRMFDLQKKNTSLGVKTRKLEKEKEKLALTLEESMNHLSSLEGEIAKINSQNKKYQEIKAELTECMCRYIDLQNFCDKNLVAQKQLQIQISTEKLENNLLLQKVQQLQQFYSDIEYNQTEYLKSSNTYIKDKARASNNGAVEKVKNSLSYKLGAALVKANKSKRIINIPADILNMLIKFNLENFQAELKSLEHLNEYSDARNAELMKQHLSYRIGYRILEDLTTVAKLKKLPAHLIDEYKSFKQKKYLPNKESESSK